MTVNHAQPTTRYDLPNWQKVEMVDEIMEDDTEVVFCSSQLYIKSTPMRARSSETIETWCWNGRQR
jgi:hypothetical protein